MNEKSSRFYRMIRDYMTVYLPKQKGASPNTAKLYRKELSQLLSYICSRNGFKLGQLSLTLLSRETVEGFLDHIEKEQGCSVTTRNNHLVSIRSVGKYSCGRDISIQACFDDLSEIPRKRARRSTSFGISLNPL